MLNYLPFIVRHIAMPRRHHHHVYVVELSPDVLYEARFKKANPDYIPGQPCVYVGMTGLDPDLRFDKHKAGICLLYTSPSPRDLSTSRMPSSA